MSNFLRLTKSGELLMAGCRAGPNRKDVWELIAYSLEDDSDNKRFTVSAAGDFLLLEAASVDTTHV